jgi:hypothetical protein
MNSIIETLEDRRLLSAVNLGGIIGPLKVGATYTYNIDLGGLSKTTEVDHIVSAKFLGKKAIEIHKTYTSSKYGSLGTLDQYVSPAVKGEYLFGQISTGSLDTVMTTYSPTLVQVPTQAIPGHVYTFHYKATEDTLVAATGKTTTRSFAITDKLKLVTSKPFSLKISGKTFQVYEVSVDETSNGITSHSESWFSPGIGLVQTVSEGGTISLTSFAP